MRTNVRIGFCLLLGLGFLGTAHAETLNWKAVVLLDSDIVFDGKLYDMDFTISQKAQSGDYTTEYQYQAWKGTAGEYSEIVSVKLIDSGYYFSRFYDFEKSFSEGHWSKWKDKDINWLDDGVVVSALGKNKFQKFVSDLDKCFAWRVQFLSESFTRNDNAYVTGYYCQKDEIEGEKLTSIIMSVDFKRTKDQPGSKVPSGKNIESPGDRQRDTR